MATLLLAVPVLAIGFAAGFAGAVAMHNAACRSRLPYVECPWNTDAVRKPGRKQAGGSQAGEIPDSEYIHYY